MIVDCQVIVSEIGLRFASGKAITVGGRELVGYTRPDGTVFKRWVPRFAAPDTVKDYVEFGEPDGQGEPSEEVTIDGLQGIVAEQADRATPISQKRR